MATADELAAYLAANGQGTVGTDIFISMLPDTPDACVAIHEYPGAPGMYVFGSGGAKMEQPKIQIVSRAATYPAARAKIEAIYQLLDGTTEQPLTGVQWHHIEALQPPYSMPLDLSNRYICQCNFQAIKDVS